MPHRHTLITGATGLVGRQWLASLTGRITALVRDPGALCARPGLDVLASDLTHPDLGLDPRTRASLAASVTAIVHCAADIRFNLPLHCARAINTAGAARVLQFAAECPHLEKFAHISTVFVAGSTEGCLPESRFVPGGFLNTYQQSKHEAEELVFESMSRLPATIYRLSSIIGDSRTGGVDQLNYFHQAIRLVPRNPLPILPVSPHARVDFIATDWAAATLTRLFEHHFEPGGVFNLSAGPDCALPAVEVVETAFHHAGRPVPELVTVEEFNRSVDRNSPAVRKLLALTAHFLPHLSLRQDFANERALATAGIPLPDSRALYRRVLHRLSTPVDRGARADPPRLHDAQPPLP